MINFDKRLLNLELPGEQVILGDQRRLVVDSFTLFRITDPLLYYQSVGPVEDGIRGRLNSIVSASLRRVLANNKLLDVLSAKRDQIMATIRDQVNVEMKGFGISIEDVRIRRADLPDENTKAILSRMQSERQRVASQARAEGAEAAQRIRADAERDRTVLVADARATSDRLRGEGEAEATRTYAKAYQQDAGFYGDLAYVAGLPRGVRDRQFSPGSYPGQRIPALSSVAAGAGRAIVQLPAAARRTICGESSGESATMRLISRPSARAATLAFAVALAVPLAAGAPIEPAFARAAPDSFADLAAKLLPAVVNISSTQAAQARAGASRRRSGNSACSRRARRSSSSSRTSSIAIVPARPGGRGDNQPPPDRRMQSLGSGFIIDASGLVVTNNHVIDGADEITVTLQDNTSLKAKVLGRDETGDIALLQVKPDKPLPAVQFGDSDTERVGDWVLAIGNPFGLGGTVTAGIVSARGRDIRQGPYDDFIQTDAAINRGNSGGPLFNMDGQVVGMNTAIYSPSGGSIGIGFSIPANMVKAVVAQLKDFGHPRRGWLGVRIQQVTPDIAESLGLKDASGAMVAGVNDGGPADKAKIHNGDIILKFNNQDVKEMRSLPRIVADSEVGKSVPVLLWRDGKEVTVQATLAEKPDDVQVAAATTGRQGAAAEAHGDIRARSEARADLAGDEGQVLARRGPEGRGDHRRRAEQFGGRARAEGGRRDRRGAAGRGVVAGRGAEEGGHRAQGEPQVGADADPAPGRLAVGAAVDFGRQGQAAGMTVRRGARRWRSESPPPLAGGGRGRGREHVPLLASPYPLSQGEGENAIGSA